MSAETHAQAFVQPESRPAKSYCDSRNDVCATQTIFIFPISRYSRQPRASLDGTISSLAFLQLVQATAAGRTKARPVRPGSIDRDRQLDGASRAPAWGMSLCCTLELILPFSIARAIGLWPSHHMLVCHHVLYCSISLVATYAGSVLLKHGHWVISESANSFESAA